jgi:thiosulfate/3-mercaptopyruvate sulfurtransferase
MKRLVRINCHIAVFVICLLAPRPSTIRSQPIQTAGLKVRSEMLVSTDWLAKHINDRDVFVIHVAGDRKHYDDGHLPGARFLSSKEILTTRNGVANELPAVADLQKVFEQVGMGDTGRIVIYGENSGLLAARVYFTLDYLGHGDRAALLDGGIEKWKAEKRMVETQPVKSEPVKFTPRPRPQIVAGLDAVRDLSRVATNAHSLEGASAAIVDARPEEQYIGNQTQRSGHIPGAASVYWQDNLVSRENPVMKSLPELSKLYEAAGLRAGQKVVTYCNTGMQASHSYFTLKYLGYDVMMYDGSFSEWSKAEGAPVATGKNRQ